MLIVVLFVFCNSYFLLEKLQGLPVCLGFTKASDNDNCTMIYYDFVEGKQKQTS